MRPGHAGPGGGEPLPATAPAGLLSFSCGIPERGAGERAERNRGSGASRQSVGKLGSSVGERKVPSPLLALGVGESWFLFLVFSVSVANSRAFGARVTDVAEPPLPGAAGRPLRGAGTPREPPGPKLEGAGGARGRRTRARA